MTDKSLSLVNNLIRKVDSDEKENDETIKSRHFIENYSECVHDAIDGGFVASSTNNVTRLFMPDKSVKVVYRSDFDGDKEVALISGGGSGHEPAHSGFIGRGMLTAVVCGEIFASPPTKAIVYAIRAVAGKRGVLLIVKNYTGDVLSFGLAASICREKYGIDTEMVVVGDDCAIGRDKAGRVGRRGIAGTVFVHKIAGYLSLKMTASQIKQFLETSVFPGIGSIGIAATSCYLPQTGMTKQERIKANTLELGLGIHGESGAMTIAFDKISGLIPQMFAILYDADADRNYVQFKDGEDVVLLINNLGGTSPMEMAIIQTYVLRYLLIHDAKKLNVKRVYNGPYLTAMDMKGFSLTLLKADDAILKALDSEVTPNAWIPGFSVDADAVVNGGQNKFATDEVDEKAQKNSGGDAVLMTDDYAQILRQLLENACGAIQEKKAELNVLDGKVGDADCGSTLDFGRKLVMNKLGSFQFKALDKTLCDLGELLSDMGGSSGALYGYFFIAAAQRIKQKCSADGVNGVAVSSALCDAVQDLMQYSGAQQGNRTLIDALLPGVTALSDFYKQNAKGDFKQALKAAAAKANEGALLTKQMKPLFGRSVYTPMQILKDVPDPGAVAVAAIFEAMCKI